MTIYTIGHSNTSLKRFIEILKNNKIEKVIDVRSFPKSRATPQFNSDTLPDNLKEEGIKYTHIPKLGGRRPKSGIVPTEVNGFWDNQSFQNYADYALTLEFREGLQTLIQTAKKDVSSMMCAESLWWRCHRRIISDYLIAKGHDVINIVGNTADEAKMTPSAKVEGDKIYYPKK
jgi:uncharacterized protein (DUF488 family)